MDQKTLKDLVEAELKKNSLLKPSQLCKILDLDYKKHGNYVTVIRSEWRSLAKKELGSNRLKFHHWHGYIKVPKQVDREAAVKQGWLPTKSRNRFYLWKSKLGRLMWFETGRVNMWLRKPANKGKAAQLLADAFFKTYLIPDIRIFEAFLASLRFKGASVTMDLGFKLPLTKISFLKKSNGVEITLGDLSHPTCIEISYYFPDYAEQMEKVLERLAGIFKPSDKMMPDRDTSYVA